MRTIMKIRYLGMLIEISILFMVPGYTQVTKEIPTPADFTPTPGDLGWGSVRGKVTDTVRGVPIAGADETYYCPGVRPCGCGTTCATKIPR
jgi:hypothetical protein